ncbi:cupredoxin domain-containing protein [Dictyobacter arantiisoli]|uniref:Blue (type 1) copper domain-containing protein n=1 Tax=Dictyobacter arantiisoli TaxID=2014874 RepID=A0A5A5THQ8_9CHLR|nr:plastocyanin/azurin family copper-binding protein [Dictyobacter arantiisoli]GCF10676.1 hypothetical protein KDI_42400 [Dictyobacter arantiisoli]
MKKIFGALIILSLLALLISACAVGSNQATGPNPVHMDDSSFKLLSIDIKKGDKITLINDNAPVHIIANGTWGDNNTPKPGSETGAPKINNLQVDGFGSGSIGPFNTAGTFQIYCTVHPGMKLTVNVK